MNLGQKIECTIVIWYSHISVRLSSVRPSAIYIFDFFFWLLLTLIGFLNGIFLAWSDQPICVFRMDNRISQKGGGGASSDKQLLHTQNFYLKTRSNKSSDIEQQPIQIHNRYIVPNDKKVLLFRSNSPCVLCLFGLGHLAQLRVMHGTQRLLI